MDICEGKTLKSASGSFGAKVIGPKGRRKLAVPPEIFSVLRTIGVNSAEGMHESLYDKRIQDRFQSLLEQELGWTVSSFMAAACRLGPVLDGHISDHLLYPVGRPKGLPQRRSRGAPRKRRKRLGVSIDI